MASSNRFQPKTGRLLVLLIPAFAYLVWASSFRVIDQVSLECIHSHVPPELMALLKGKDVMVGVIDVANDVVESADEVADTIGRALQFVPRERLIPCTNCGLAPMRREVAEAKLRALADGAALARQRYGAG